MSIQTWGRCAIALWVVSMVAGCGFIGGGNDDAGVQRDSACRWNRSSCMYEGPYEPGERDYAEEEARRLNREQADRLRRSSGR